MNTYECRTCGHLYSEADGDPLNGVAAGTRWEDLPADWICSDCGATKADFDLLES